MPAMEGTAAHELAEKILLRLKKDQPFDLHGTIGTTIMVEDNEFEVTEEMVEAVDMYVESVIGVLDKAGTDSSFLHVEERFSLEVDKYAYGTNDAFLYRPFNDIHLWDLKYGRGVVVDVKQNKQLMYYALGAIQGRDVKEVVTYIVQPRAYHPDGPIRKCTYSVEELKYFGEILKIRIDATRKKDAPLVAGDHCRWCRASSICPMLKEEANEIAVQDFSKVSTLDLPTMVKLADMQPRIVEYLKDVKNHLHSIAEKGSEVPGYKLVKARSNRRWKSEARFVSAFTGKYGNKILAPSKILSPAKMEKLIDKKELLPFIEKPDTGLTLVKDSDPREAVKSSAAEDFDGIL